MKQSDSISDPNVMFEGPGPLNWYIPSHRGCSMHFHKKEMKVLSIPKHSITSEASVLRQSEIRNSDRLEIAGNTHSPFCPYLADYSVCVPPALQKDWISDFTFGKNWCLLGYRMLRNWQNLQFFFWCKYMYSVGSKWKNSLLYKKC